MNAIEDDFRCVLRIVRSTPCTLGLALFWSAVGELFLALVQLLLLCNLLLLLFLHARPSSRPLSCQQDVILSRARSTFRRATQWDNKVELQPPADNSSHHPNLHQPFRPTQMTLTTSRRSYAAAAATNSSAAVAKPSPVDSNPNSGELPTTTRARMSYAADAEESDREDHRSWCSTPTHSLAASDADVDTSSASSSSDSEEEKEYLSSPSDSFACSLPLFPSPQQCQQMYDDELFVEMEEAESIVDDEEEECFEDPAAFAAVQAAAELAQERFDDAVDFYSARLDGARCFRAVKLSRFNYESVRQISQMRRVLTQPHKLSAACAKSSPVLPCATPYSNNRTRNERLHIQPMYRNDKSLSSERPVERKQSTRTIVHKPKVKEMKTEERRALQMKIRNLPQCVRTCTNSRWSKVLQHRLMTRQIVRERNAWRRSVKRTRADKLATARKIKSAKFHSEIHMHRKDRLSLLPAGCSIHLAQAAHWQLKYSDAIRREQTKSAPVITSVLPAISAPAPDPLTPFERFRLSWYARHRDQIQNAVSENSSYHVSAVRCADLNKNISSSFMRLRNNLNQRDPILAFHGTNQTNHPSILQNGFLIPGKLYAHCPRIGVANGSAYGKGIYSSTDLMMSLGYTRCSGPMLRLFVCATLTDQSRSTQQLSVEVKHHGTMLIFFREQRIVPVFTIDVAMGPRKQPMREEGELDRKRSPDRLDADAMVQEKLRRPDLLVAKSNLRQELRKHYTKAARITRAWKNAFRKMLQAEEGVHHSFLVR